MDAFTSAFTDTEEWVERTGKIFAAGTYPERNLIYTEADLDAVVAAFAPVPLELEHFDTVAWHSILTGKLGELTRVWRDGTALCGTVRVPAWIDRVWAEAGRKVSVAFASPTDKTLRRCGLVLQPRVPDAALFAAYSAFAGARHSATDLADLQAIHDLAAKQGAVCADPPAPMPKEARMSFVDTVRAWFDAGMPAEYRPDPAPAAEPAPTFSAAPDPTAADKAALDAERVAFAAEKAAFAQAQYTREAQATVERLITEGHAWPAQNQPNAEGQPALVAAFAQALADDAAAPVTFSVAGGSRFAALQAAFRSAPAHQMFTEVIPDSALVVPAGGNAAPNPDAEAKERQRKLKEKTPIGRAALAIVPDKEASRAH